MTAPIIANNLDEAGFQDTLNLYGFARSGPTLSHRFFHVPESPSYESPFFPHVFIDSNYVSLSRPSKRHTRIVPFRTPAELSYILQNYLLKQILSS